MELRLLVAGALVAVGSSCAPSSIGAASPRTIVIEMEHSRFHPSRLVVSRGETVTFVIRNTDPIDHELILGDEAVQARHETGSESHHGDKPGEVSIPAGAMRKTTYTFDEPGTLIFGCHLPRHYGYGMRGEVSVRS